MAYAARFCAKCNGNLVAGHEMYCVYYAKYVCLIHCVCYHTGESCCICGAVFNPEGVSPYQPAFCMDA